MSNTIYILFHDVGQGPSDFSYYWHYEDAVKVFKKKGWGYQIVAVDEGSSDE